MNLWPHQQQAIDELIQLILSGHKRICVTSPTGGGKTRLAMARLIESGLPSVFYTHRRMLLSQTSANFDSMGINHGIRASGHDQSLLHDIQLAMIQSESAAVYRSKKRELHDAKEVIIDEAHNNSAGQAQRLIDDHDCVTIGLTATPLGIGHIYDSLVVAGTNSELRECGAHVPAYSFGPDEPSTRLVGKIAIGEGECGITQAKRQIFAQRVFGSVIEHYPIFNQEQKPTLLFAPGVPESIWFCQTLCESGIKSAHIDGKNCWLDGELIPTTDEVKQEIAARCKNGEIKIVCNRFVLREGVDWPWIGHMIFATVFGSLTSYLQAGGRGLRACPDVGKERVTIGDHGGNWWRHGSLNADRHWRLIDTDRIVGNERLERIREKKEHEPIHCPKCNMIRLMGPKCQNCGHQSTAKTRPVLQADGSLREMKNDTFRQRRRMPMTDKARSDWVGRVNGVRRSKKETVKRMTFAQVQVRFAQDHDWQYPPKDLPMMPINDADWFRAVQSVPLERLTR